MIYKLTLLLLSFVPNTSETTVVIHNITSIENKATVYYRLGDIEKSHNFIINENDPAQLVRIPETTVRIGWSYEWVFEEWEWIVDCEPGTRVVWE
jgi:hypothetical protein